jgi:hypothetical protein
MSARQFFLQLGGCPGDGQRRLGGLPDVLRRVLVGEELLIAADLQQNAIIAMDFIDKSGESAIDQFGQLLAPHQFGEAGIAGAHIIPLVAQSATPNRQSQFGGQKPQPFQLLPAKRPGDLAVLQIYEPQPLALMTDGAAEHGFGSAVFDIRASGEAGIGLGLGEQEVFATVQHIVDDSR